jgi:hypothetical protein
MNEMDALKLEYAERYVADMEQAAQDYHKLQDKLESIRSAAMPGAMRYDKANVQVSPTADVIPDAVIRSLEFEDDLEAAVAERVDEYEQFLGNLIRLDSLGSVYLYDYYSGNFRTWGAIWRHYQIDGKTGRKRCDEALVELYDSGMLPIEYRIPSHKAI